MMLNRTYNHLYIYKFNHLLLFDQYLKRIPWLNVFCSKIRSKLNKMKQSPIECHKNSIKHITWQKNSNRYVSGCKFNCGKNMNEYFEATTLHGLKYVGLTRITLLER